MLSGEPEQRTGSAFQTEEDKWASSPIPALIDWEWRSKCRDDSDHECSRELQCPAPSAAL